MSLVLMSLVVGVLGTFLLIEISGRFVGMGAALLLVIGWVVASPILCPLLAQWILTAVMP